MAKTRTHPMDFMTRDNIFASTSERTHEIIEQGRQEFIDKVLSPMMGTLKEIDPDWEKWYDENIPKIVALRGIADRVEERIDYIITRDMLRDYADQQDTIQSILSSMHPY